ncbi:MAG TPA: Asp-tRNA(Asn)/Glu-tRNA(Gln) amidotransferase subunit GatB [Planctomycetota bacterium]|nr:Asp-tRNA(Asn)/Glu-tRNA(Gln) amidotransferase subunit GatB [Planctomycetota bacterium]
MAATAVDYELVAGIETHVQLDTRTKMFCACAVRFGAPPNSLTCPVCLGHPGTLPTLNGTAVELGLRAAVALGCTIAPRTKFDRKNYYYPDLPKNYQISQFDLPLATAGAVEIRTKAGPRRIRIHRAHLEEDAGKLIHEDAGTRSFVDLNRAGVPLLEIVTEPDLRSAEEAHAYLSSLKGMLRAAGISNCDMEKGELRCDVNVSIRPRGSDSLGVKTEVKNLNSFRFVQKALEAEYRRHVAEVEAGRPLVQATLLYDPEKNSTRIMRVKEGAVDYRYFPEPDLPPLEISAAEIEAARTSLPEMPAEKAARYVRDFALGDYEANIISSDKATAAFFEAAARAAGKARTVANWVVNEIPRFLNEGNLTLETSKLTPAALVELLGLIDAGIVTVASAKEALAKSAETGRSPAEIVREGGMATVTDSGAIEKSVDAVIAANPKAVADFKGGKDSTIKFLVGQVMKATQGRVKAQAAEELLRRKLSST